MRWCALDIYHSVPAVREVLATVHSPATVNVSWTLFYTGGSPVDLFSVQYRKNNSDWWRTGLMLSQIASNVSSTLVRGLEGGVVYVFGVAATNELGKGEITVSMPIISHALGIAPPTGFKSSLILFYLFCPSIFIPNISL